MILSADTIWYVAHVMSRYIAGTDRDYFVFDQIEAKMWTEFWTQIESTFRTRCSNRALVTRFIPRYYLLQIIVLSIKNERKKKSKCKGTRGKCYVRVSRAK